MKVAHTHRRLLLGSALAVTGLFSYGRSAYAACVVTVSPTYECSGVNVTTQSILNVTGATVSTLPGFSVNAAAGNGIEISGDGAISFTDVNNSTITSGPSGLTTHGLDITGIGGGAGSVTVDINSIVTGAVHAISAVNNGIGALSITADGNLTGNGGYGIYANQNAGAGLQITTGVNASILGGTVGIRAFHDGTGNMLIDASGDVTGTANYGIDAVNYAGTANLTISTGALTQVIGGVTGIQAKNYGAGILSITAQGDVDGISSYGIFGQNDGTDLFVTTGIGTMVHGDFSAIGAFNKGSGDLTVIANGDVTGDTGRGINAINTLAGQDINVTTGVGTEVQGGTYGILVTNNGIGGAATVGVSGNVTGTTGDGIRVRNVNNFTTNIAVTSDINTAVSGGQNGIWAKNEGSGALVITANGDVTGTSLAGIHADNAVAGTDLTITTDGAVLGGAYGIRAINNGSGTTSITNNGGLSTISPTPGFSFDGIAIQTEGTTPVLIGNGGTIFGRVNTGDGGDNFVNIGLWASTGVSDLGAGTNQMGNAGSLVAAVAASTSETTTFANAGTFTNAGTMSLSDDTAGNGSQAHDTLTINGDFAGGGGIFMDAYLGGPGSTADLMIVTGNVSGVTQLQVLNTSSGGGAANLDGIALVQVNGTSAAGDFVLADGPISAGLFTYDLQFDAVESVHELVSTGAAAVSAELATFASAAQSIWYDTLGVLDDRFDELHREIRSAAIVSDDTLVQPVSYSPAAQTGLWGKLIGRMSDRNATSSVGGVATDISYGLDATGLVIGVDGVLDGVNGSLALGVTGGYVNADQDFDSGSAANYEGFTGGLYATYVSGNFHVNGQFKANALDLDYTMAGTSGTSDADVISLGAALETGYRVDVSSNFYAEPAAQLAYVDSNTRNGDALGTAFNAGGDSLRGAIGLNLGGKISGSYFIFKPELTLKIWGEFEGDNSASFTAFTVADNTPGVFGEAGLGIEALSLSNGWSGNFKGDIQFGEDFTSFGGFAGLRKSF